MIILTGLWKVKMKDGRTMLTGRINNVDVIILPTKEKKSDKHPDFNLCLAPKQNDKKTDADDDLPF